jgi:uncharacterized membrane protein
MLLDFSFSSPRSRFRAALVVAIVADVVQMVGFPLFVEGALSPVDDILDFVMGAALTGLLGWHWEFTPSLIAKLIPGVDLVPLWTLAVFSVYRKWKRTQQPDDKQPGDQVDVIDVAPLDQKLLKH